MWSRCVILASFAIQFVTFIAGVPPLAGEADPNSHAQLVPLFIDESNSTEIEKVLQDIEHTNRTHAPYTTNITITHGEPAPDIVITSNSTHESELDNRDDSKDMWLSTFRILIDRTGKDFGWHVNIEGYLQLDYTPRYTPFWFHQRLFKLQNFKTSPSDHAREIYEEIRTTKGRPIQLFKAVLRENAFLRHGRYFLNATRDVRGEDLWPLRMTRHEVCYDELHGAKYGFAARIRRCIQYLG